MKASVPALLKAAAGPDAKVRPAALKRVGELAGPTEFSALLDLIMQFEARQDLDAAEQALSAVCAKADNPGSYTSKLTNGLSKATPAQKIALLRVLSVIGGTDALNAVREAANDSNAQVSDAAIRVLCSWKTADAAGDLLALAKNSSNRARKTAALRGYINLVRDDKLSIAKKLGMSRQASALIQRSALRIWSSAQRFGSGPALSASALIQRSALRLWSSAQRFGSGPALSASALVRRSALRL